MYKRILNFVRRAGIGNHWFDADESGLSDAHQDIRLSAFADLAKS